MKKRDVGRGGGGGGGTLGSPRSTNLRFSWLVGHVSSNPNTSDQIKMAFAEVFVAENRKMEKFK